MEYVLSDSSEAPSDLLEQSRVRPRKRSLRSEEETSAKRRRTDPQLRSDTFDEAASQALAEKNLRRLRRSEEHEQGLILEWMSLQSNNSGSARGRGNKRTRQDTNRGPSRSQSRNSASTTTNLTQQSKSQRSQKTCSNATYRFTVLQRARIHIEYQPSPEAIQNQIDAIIENEIPAERKKMLAGLAQTFCDNFAQILGQAPGEDGCVELLCHALSTMGYRNRLVLARKAGKTF